jgi:hypothetical protein
LAVALLSFAGSCVIWTATASASLTPASGDGAPAVGTRVPSPTAPEAQLSNTPTVSAPTAIVPTAVIHRPVEDLGRFSTAIDPDRILRQDFRLAPKLPSTPPADTLLSNTGTPPDLRPTPPRSHDQAVDDDRPDGGDLAVPLPAIGAGWALFIGASMYQFGSRALRLRR